MADIPIKNVINKRARIYFELFMSYYHNGEHWANTDIIQKLDVTKSEVSSCIREMMEQGYIESISGKRKKLTEKGFAIAEEYHKKYEFAFTIMKTIYSDIKKASDYAVIFVLTQGNEMFDTEKDKFNISPIAEKLQNYSEFDGVMLGDIINEGLYRVDYQFMTIPDSNIKIHGQAMHSMRFNINIKEIPNNLPVLCNDDIYKFKEKHSMADMAFLHPAYLKFSNGKGKLCLHRITIHRENMNHMLMEGKARDIKYFDGEKFIGCNFIGDDIEIPIDNFSFNRICGKIYGKLIMQFSCTVGDRFMPVSAAVCNIIL